MPPGHAPAAPSGLRARWRLPTRFVYPLALAFAGLTALSFLVPASLPTLSRPFAGTTATSSRPDLFAAGTRLPVSPGGGGSDEPLLVDVAAGADLRDDRVWAIARRGRRDPWQAPTPPLPVDASTEERLRAWELDSPRGEGAELVKWSAEACPPSRTSPNRNNHMLETSHLLWSSLNSSSIVTIRSSMIAFLRSALASGALDERHWGTGRGLVFTAGNADTFGRVKLTLRMLRTHLQTQMPAEVFSFPGETPPEDVRQELEQLGATLHVVDDQARDQTKTKNYQLKASALVRSSFREVLYLDSDNLPAAFLGNASAGTFSDLWDSKSYRRTGAMLFPDYWKTTADNPVWQILGTQCRDEWEMEAGQILVDKSRHLDVLLLSEYMLKDWDFWFHFSDGDKDIFRFAWLALRKRWAVPGRYLGAGALPGDTMTGFCGHTMLQHDHTGRPLFVHMNLLKQIPSGVMRGYSWGRTRSLKGFQGEGEEEYVDWDVDADMLANTGNDGRGINDAPEAVRRRAAAERGVRGFLHGGWISAVCADMKWEDPRTKEEREAESEAYLAYAKAHPAVYKPEPAAEGEQKSEEELRKEAAERTREVAEKTTLSKDGQQIVWESPLEVRQWSDDERLKDFEAHFYDLGGSPNGKGF